MTKIDIMKHTTTRDGRKVRDLHELSEPLNSGETIIGVIRDSGGSYSTSWHANGSLVGGVDDPEESDLINPPEMLERHINFYQLCIRDYATEKNARRYRNSDCIAYKAVTYTPGEGLEVGGE